MQRLYVVLFGCCLLVAGCGGIGGGGGPAATPTHVHVGHGTPRPTITPGGPTFTPKPTHTRVPTITPGGPTLTPHPTKTPGGPTRTPTATIIPGSVPQLFVRISGNDGNDGQSPDTAVQTLSRALKMVAPGTTVYVGPGQYSGLVTVHGFGATAGFPLRLVADTKGTHTGDAPGPVELDAGGAVSSMIIENSTNVVVDGFTLTGAMPQVLPKKLTASAIELRAGSDHSTVRNCVIIGNGQADGMRIRASGVLAFNNLITNIFHGVEISGSVTGVTLINNTIAITGGTGVSLTLNAGAAPSGTILKNNIIQESHKVSILVDQGPPTALQGYDSSFNLVFQPNFGTNQDRDYLPIRARGANDINEDAQFVRSSGGDFHLKPTSPAIDAGDDNIDSTLLNTLFMRSTTSDGKPDKSPVDIGYHYPVR
jgi:hypothetical protein